MKIIPLSRDRLDEARALLGRALAYDRGDLLAEEKLFGSNGPRTGRAYAAVDGERLIGVAAAAGRYVKLVAVDPGARGHGVGGALLDAARAESPGKLRLCDHPGNYLTPGVDLRDVEARAFFARRGFRPVCEIENIRAPLEENPLITAGRSAELDARSAAEGYPIARVDGVTRAAVLDWISRTFAPIWAFEAERALSGPRQALHAAFRLGAPVAFAAADGNNQGLGWFGPAGTAPDHRGRGLGEALLLRCLLDVKGLPDAGVIAWIGPKPFYARACGAVDDRTFVVYEES